MRTQEEILKKIEDVKNDDWIGVKTNDLVGFLTFENAKPFLKEGITEKEWSFKEPTKENVLKEMSEYVEFAWSKANDCRGISADRSIDHFTTWIWLLGDDEFNDELENIEYEHYGKEKLIAICEKYGFDWKKFDDGVRTNG